MVVLKVHGGLGNQMFQYAFGRCLSVQNDCALKMDLSFYERQNDRPYQLNALSIAAQMASAPEREPFTDSGRTKVRWFKRLFVRPVPRLIKEQTFSFNPAYLKIRKNVYLDGYWQSEQYFREIAPLIRKELMVSVPPSAENRRLLAEIRTVNAISVHIRRGDFQHNEAVNRIHGTCPVNYYTKGMQLLAERTNEPVFYIFSDDPDWARKNIAFNGEIRYLAVNSCDKAFEDLRLMYTCKHHITANSTFSWWGAWLNDQPGKIVISPERWFKDPQLNAQANSIVPPTWIRL